MSTKPAARKAPPPELVAIREAAQRLAVAQQALVARANLQQAEIAAAIAPITARHLPGMEIEAEERAAAQAALLALVEAAPTLFVRPRSVVVDGVRAGYRKDEDQLDWDDEAGVIARIRAVLPELEEILVRKQESLVIDALAQLTGAQLQRLGVRQITGADRPFVTIGEGDVDKLVKAILADIQRRIGEDETPKKKGKAKIKEAA